MDLDLCLFWQIFRFVTSYNKQRVTNYTQDFESYTITSPGYKHLKLCSYSTTSVFQWVAVLYFHLCPNNCIVVLYLLTLTWRCSEPGSELHLGAVDIWSIINILVITQLCCREVWIKLNTLWGRTWTWPFWTQILHTCVVYQNSWFYTDMALMRKAGNFLFLSKTCRLQEKNEPVFFMTSGFCILKIEWFVKWEKSR